MEAISLYLQAQKGESFTLSEISKSIDISKDTLRHQAKRALAAGHIEIVGDTTRSSATPAHLFRAVGAVKRSDVLPEKREAQTSEAARVTEEKDALDEACEAYLQSAVSCAAMESMCLILCGVSQVPESVKKMVEERKVRRSNFDFA